MEYYEAIETLAELVIHNLAEMGELNDGGIEYATEEVKNDVKEMVKDILKKD